MRAGFVVLVAALVASMGGAQAQQPATAKLHKQIGTAIDSNGVVTSLLAGTNVIDTTSVKCGATNGCIVDVGSMAQVIADTSGQWSICVLIDGQQASPGCPVQGTVPSSNYVVGNLKSNAFVANGSHTVQMQVQMPAAGSIAAWQVDITLLKN
ncbi:MAG: hypothetical protein JO261_09620 [Alphaproteobacteria bacterium]|nr:hypothetical protein [Alphaproteobacteria bacterium]MBV9693947.1 hypothetical protein [Alphaproteobacteria bacterium]